MFEHYVHRKDGHQMIPNEFKSLIYWRNDCQLLESELQSRFNLGQKGINIEMIKNNLARQLLSVRSDIDGTISDKKFLVLACGAVRNRDELQMSSYRLYEPWLPRALAILGAAVVFGIDIQTGEEREPYQHIEFDLSSGKPLPEEIDDKSIDVVTLFHILGSPSLGGQRNHKNMMTTVSRGVCRVLKDDGALVTDLSGLKLEPNSDEPKNTPSINLMAKLQNLMNWLSRPILDKK